MTSPSDLPFVTAGMIWDGVTEYQDIDPPGEGITFVLHMYGDRTRRFRVALGTAQPMTQLLRSKADGWEQIGICFEVSRVYYDTGFLGYDGSMSHEPVNQFFQLNQFKNHAARFAHELDAGMGLHSLSSSDERDSEIVRQTISAIIGSAARRYQKWEDIDPEELIDGGLFDGTPLWKQHERTPQNYADIDEALCGQCGLSNLARQLKKKGDLAAFRRVWRQGLIYGVDRSTTPWSPELFDSVNQPEQTVSEFYDELDDFYDLMIDHYDEVVGAAEHI